MYRVKAFVKKELQPKYIKNFEALDQVFNFIHNIVYHDSKVDVIKIRIT